MTSNFDTVYTARAVPVLMGQFGEDVTYGGGTVTAIVLKSRTPEQNENDLKSLWPIREFEFSIDDAEDAAPGDLITHDGIIWQVDGIAERTGSMIRLNTIMAATNWALTHSATHSVRSTGSTDGLGRPVYTFTPAGSSVACRYIDEGAKKLTRDLQLVIQSPVLLVAPSFTGVAGDQLSAITGHTGTYTILSIINPWGEGHHRQLKLEKVGGS